MRPPQHAVPLRPGFFDLSFGVYPDDAVLPTPVHILRAVVRTIQRAWRTGRRRIAPRQTADGKADARPQLGEVNFPRSLDVRQFAALKDENPVGVLRENALGRSPRPLFVPGHR